MHIQVTWSLDGLLKIFFFFFFKVCFEYIILIFVLSLKCCEQFLLSLLPVQNCGNDKLLSPKYNILEPVWGKLF